MTITKKPRASETTPAIPEANIQALIEKGGSVARKGEEEPGQATAHSDSD